MTENELEELELLRLMTKDTHKFALEVNYHLTPKQQAALERLMLRDWIRLIDVNSIAQYPRTLFRVFRVMPEAVAWYESKWN